MVIIENSLLKWQAIKLISVKYGFCFVSKYKIVRLQCMYIVQYSNITIVINTNYLIVTNVNIFITS